MGFLLRVRPLEAHSPSAYILTPDLSLQMTCDLAMSALADIDADAEQVRFWG